MSAAATPGDRVVRVASLEVRAEPGPWAFALARADDIARHWRRRHTENPLMFDGQVLVMTRHALDGGRFTGTMVPVAFSAYLLWREEGYCDAATLSAFSTAIVRAADSALIMVRAAAHTVNGARLQMPGGFIDSRDVGADGRIDVVAATERELAEETGLAVGGLVREPGYVLTFSGRSLSLGVAYRSPLSAEALTGAVSDYLARGGDGELSGVVAVRAGDRVLGDAVPFARRLAAHILKDA